MLHGIEIAGAFYLLLTAALWLWGLLIRFRWDGISRHVLGYHTLASLIAVDEYANVLTAGNFDETISTRLGIAAKQGRWWGLIGRNFLEELQRDHCSMALLNDARRAAAEREFLKSEEKA